MKNTKKLLALGLLVAVTSTTSFANTNENKLTTEEINEMFSVEKYIEYVKSLNILNDEEMKKFEETKIKIDSLYDEIEEIESNESLTDEQINLIAQKTKEIDILEESITSLNEKIKPDVTEEEVTLEEYLDYIKSLDILTDEEFSKYSKAEYEIEKLYETIDSIYEKERFLENQDEKLNKIYEEVDKLEKSIHDITLKIEKVDSQENFLRNNLNYIKSLNVLTDEEFSKYAQTKADIEVLFSSVDDIFEKENLTKEEQKRLDKVYDEVEKLEKQIFEIECKIGEADSKQDSFTSYINYIKSLNVLTQAELNKYIEVQEQINALYEKSEDIYAENMDFKEQNLTKEDEKLLESLYKKVEKIHESVYDIMLKIEEAESNY